MDAAHRATDKELERIEKKLTQIYSQAAKELGEKSEKYFERFKVLDQQKRALVKAGKMTEADYKKWRQGKIMTGEHWKEMQKQAAQRLTEADRIAVEYTNGRLPYVYSLNYNSVAEGLETGLKGYSFELVDEATVRNLAESDKTLLPYKKIDRKKAERWHTARVNAEVTQGIIQGESIPEIAKRLKTNVGMTAKGSAVRNARTSVTSAENKGRIDMLHDAREKGVIVDKIWIAAHDSRTREAHLDLDGQQVSEDEMFQSILGEIEYPGDPDADPANTYNCRCSLGYKVVGFAEQQKDELLENGENEGYEKSDFLSGLEQRKIEYRDVQELESTLSEKEMIEKIGGGDMTKGSCSSLSLAYVGNASGYDVLDFRGGESLSFFAKTGHIEEISRLRGVVGFTEKSVNDFKAVNEVLKKVEYGKNYILSTGKHVAIIRRLEDSGFQYLELQSATDNGFKKLTTSVLKDRFGCRKTHTIYGEKLECKTTLIDAETLGKNSEFRNILGYINTDPNSQMKGSLGRER